MNNNPTSLVSYLITTMTLRRVVGILGIALPFGVSLLAWIIFKTGLQSSISSYYHTGMRDVFVGALCATGVFLFCYKGYEPEDNSVINWAGLFAIGIAIFPTIPDGTVTNQARIIGYVHLVFGAAFFLALSRLSLKLFTKTSEDPNIKMTNEKKQRNKVYKICAYIMAVCVLLMAIFAFLPAENALLIKTYRPIFWLETIALVVFGFSWLVKGETLWMDVMQQE